MCCGWVICFDDCPGVGFSQTQNEWNCAAGQNTCWGMEAQGEPKKKAHLEEKGLVSGGNPSENEREDKVKERKAMGGEMRRVELMKARGINKQVVKNAKKRKYMCLCRSRSSNTCAFVYVTQDVSLSVLSSANSACVRRVSERVSSSRTATEGLEERRWENERWKAS